jgi:hypothetical protein
MGKFQGWWLRAVTGLITAVLLSGTASQVVRVSADPGDNGITAAPSNGSPVAPGPLVPVPVGSSVWQEFSFGAVGVDARGCSPVDPLGAVCIAGVNSVFVGAPPWTFTAPASGAVLQVTDAFLVGDRFEIFDSLVSKGQTSIPGTGLSCGSDPDPCFASVNSNSHGSFTMAPGAHSITIRPTASPSGGGAAYFRVVPVPARCSVVQSAGASGGNITLKYTYDNTVPVTWNLYVVIGNQVFTVASAPIPATEPPVSVGPFTFPFPPSGNVGFLTTMTTRADGILCSDWDVVDTGTPLGTAGAPSTLPQIPALGGNGVE